MNGGQQPVTKIQEGKIKYVGTGSKNGRIQRCGVQGNKLLAEEVSPKKPPYYQSSIPVKNYFGVLFCNLSRPS
jgi:hypothetical protein